MNGLGLVGGLQRFRASKSALWFFMEQRTKISYRTVFSSGLGRIRHWAGRTNGDEGNVLHVGQEAGDTKNTRFSAGQELRWLFPSHYCLVLCSSTKFAVLEYQLLVHLYCLITASLDLKPKF